MGYVIVNTQRVPMTYYAVNGVYVKDRRDAREFRSVRRAFAVLRSAVEHGHVDVTELHVNDVSTDLVVNRYAISTDVLSAPMYAFRTKAGTWSTSSSMTPITFPTEAAAADHARSLNTTINMQIADLLSDKSKPLQNFTNKQQKVAAMTDDEILAAAEKIKERRSRRVAVSFLTEVRDRWSGEMVTQTQAFELDITGAVQLRNDIDRQLKEFGE